MDNKISETQKDLISTKEAKKLLGKNFRHLSEEEILLLIKSLQNFATIFLNTRKARPP